MGVVNNKSDVLTFSPGLCVDDVHAIYWMRQVTARLRREICWCWHERGLLSNSDSATLPPFVDKASANLSMSRYWEEKNVFFETDPTAQYLTEQIKSAAPPGGEPCVKGSFGWVIDKLDLDDTASFVLALGLAVAFDNAVGSVVAACLNDPGRTYPNLALAQKLWDEPEQVMMLADASHPLFSYGLLQRGDQTSAAIDWESPIAVPSLVANHLLFPNSPFPSTLAPVIGNDEEIIVPDSARLVASRLVSKNGDALRILPICGPRGSALIEIVRGVAELINLDVVRFKGDPSLIKNSQYLNSLATLCWLKSVDLFIDQNLMLAGNKQSPDTFSLPLQSIPVTIFIGITERSQLANIPNQGYSVFSFG